MREDPQTLTVKASVRHWRICTSETMHALPDPAHPDQAVLQNVPFFVDGLHFGDVVRLGPPDELGIRPIEAVVTTSGHVRFLALTGPLAIPELADHLEDTFPEYALRTEGDGEYFLAVSVHPDLDPDDVAFEMILWFEEHGVLPGADSIGISEATESEIGPLR
jgi:Domain of unknown function (DUF4265)